MPASVPGLIGRAWRSFRDSFDGETIVASCRPAGAILPVVIWVGAILAFRYLPAANKLVELDNALLPSVVTVLAGIGSIFSWFVGAERKGELAAFQLMENTFWGAAFITTAAYSHEHAAYVFCGMFSLCCIYWGLHFSFTLIGVLPLLASPLLFFALGKIDFVAYAISLVGFLLFFSAGSLTGYRRRHFAYTARSEDVLNRLETVFDSCRAGATAELKTQFGSLAHRLRTALYLAVDDIDEIRESSSTGPDQAKLASASAGRIRETVAHLDAFLKGFGKDTENPSFRLPTLASSIDTVGRDGREADLDWLSLPDVNVCGQEAMMALSIQSLFDNAIEAGASSISVSGEIVGGDQLLLKVADDGPGLPAPVREHLFKPYNTFGKKHGVGLGIYLAGQIVRAAGGSIDLADTGPSGTCFHILLPLADAGVDPGDNTPRAAGA